MRERNRRFYQRYPEHVAKVRLIARSLLNEPVQLPSGGMLTARRFSMLGLLLGSSSGFETLHQLFEAPFLGGLPMPEVGTPVRLSREFLRDVEGKQAGFETNPIYWILHESIYASGEHQPTQWAAERVRTSLAGLEFDLSSLADATSEFEKPFYFSGEMVYSWMSEDFSDLSDLRDAAELLASKADWPALYNEAQLRDCKVPVAALVAYDDIYVEREFSEKVASLLGDKCSVWVSNQFAHSGLRDDPAVFGKLLEMSKGEGGMIPC
mmetsp:Transcript_29521/g.69077  ORF Transcript_29521/g.69077 Transcript_29521/m.69077 type:complete len:266 (+) Transcript_29521:269-1066(+)